MPKRKLSIDTVLEDLSEVLDSIYEGTTTVTALEDSVKKWDAIRRVLRALESYSYAEACPLCKVHYKDDCTGCPVSECTGKEECDDTPWHGAKSAIYEAEYRAGKEQDFLKTLL